MSSECGFLLRLAAGRRIGWDRRLARTAAVEDGLAGIGLGGSWKTAAPCRERESPLTHGGHGRQAGLNFLAEK